MLNLEQNIKNKLPSSVREALGLICENSDGYKIYLVGGVVRDLILDREIFDVDITVQGDAIKFARFLEKKNVCKISRVQKDLKTAKTVFENGVEIDFASTRMESYPKKGCMPEIDEIGCSLVDDVKRRDFTVNALIASLNKEDYGEVIDYVNGLEDLQNKQLRVLHDQSFIDDPTRIIRGLKFSVRFGFSLENKTRELQNDYLQNHLTADICYSRVKSELKQTFSLNSAEVFNKFVSQKIYRLINKDYNPDSYKTIDGEKINELINFYKPENSWLVYAGIFLFNSPIPMDYEKREKKILTDVSMMIGSYCESDNFSVYKFYNNKALESILIYNLLTENYSAIDFLDHFSHVKIQVNGQDLMDLGIKPSAQMGELLDAVLEEKLSGNLFTRDDEIRFLRFRIKELKK